MPILHLPGPSGDKQQASQLVQMRVNNAWLYPWACEQEILTKTVVYALSGVKNVLWRVHQEKSAKISFFTKK